MQGKTWMFTLNNYTDEQVAFLEAHAQLDNVIRMTVSKEVGEQGTPHLQGCITWKSNKRLSACRKIIQAHWTKADKPDDAHAYPCKEDSDVFIQIDKRHAGKRVDLEAMTEQILACDTLHDVYKVPGVAKYVTWAEKLWSTRPLEAESIDTFRPWQHVLYQELMTEPDDRKIIWYHDEKGGSGKTTMAKHMITMGGFYCRSGKDADIAHAYQNQRLICFDLARSSQEHVNYRMIETLKDGLVFSPKYQSAMKVRKAAAHVVVFSNFLPDMSKLSTDRWDIRDCQSLPPTVPSFTSPDWLDSVDLSFLDD